MSRMILSPVLIANLSSLYWLLLLAPFAVSTSYGQDAAATPKANVKAAAKTAPDVESTAIRAQSEAFVAAFNKKDAKAVAEFWTPDGEYIDDEEVRYAGRETIEKGYTQFFKANPDAKLSLTVDSIRLLSASAATEDGQAVMESLASGAPSATKYTAFHVKLDGKWRIASLRDFPESTPTSTANLADLQWLIGDWIAEEHGVKSESTCNWIANKAFVERRYSTRHLDGTSTSGLQIIGWDASIGSIKSWNFGPDGGHASGAWSPIEGGWIAQVQGATAEGVPTTAVNILKRLDDSAYSWQSTQRQIGDQSLPDTEEVVIKRQRKTTTKK